MAKKLMKGCEAIAEAAVQAGCRCYFGYPITPQTDIPEYLSARMPEVGGVFVQAESEIAAANMVYGAAGAGARVMTSSSSPGISLKQEALSTIAGAELPCVVLNVMRGGPGIGGIAPSQGDYYQATRGGGHGDYRQIVLAPASVQEAADIMYSSFALADKYRMIVMVLADGFIGQMMEPVDLPMGATPEVEKPWAATGWTPESDRPRAVINSLYIKEPDLTKLHERFAARYAEIEANEVRYEAYQLEDAEFVIYAYGTMARICKSAIAILANEGIKVGMVRPITLWPFPTKAVYEAAALDSVKSTLTVEISAGQMFDDVRIGVNGVKPTEFLGYAGSKIPTVDEIVAKIKSMKGVE